MTKMNKRPPRFNPDYPEFIVPDVMCKTQMEIIDMVEAGTFKPGARMPEVEGSKAPQTKR